MKNSKWTKYNYVCTNCDASIEYDVDLNKVSHIFMINITCVCSGKAIQVSVPSDIIL